MNCDTYREMISVSLDAELSREEERVLAEHLRSCRECREFRNSLERLGDAIAAWGPTPIPLEVEAAILREVATPRRGLQRLTAFLGGHYRVPRGLVWMAVALLVTFVISTVDRSSETPPESVPAMQIDELTPGIQRLVMSETDIVYVQTFAASARGKE